MDHRQPQPQRQHSWPNITRDSSAAASTYRSRDPGALLGVGAGSEADGGGVAKVVNDAHDGAVLALSHVEGSLSLRLSERQPEEGEGDGEDGVGAGWSYESLFVSGGKGEQG